MTERPAAKELAASGVFGAGSALLTLGGIAAAFGLASCCGLPLLLASAGLGTAWLTGFALLAAPHRSVLLLAGAAGLAGGAAMLWRQQRAGACAPGALCARPAAKVSILLGLLLGAALLYLGYTYA